MTQQKQKDPRLAGLVAELAAIERALVTAVAEETAWLMHRASEARVEIDGIIRGKANRQAAR